MRVKLLQSRLMRGSRFLVETYGGVEHGERGKRYFIVRDADKTTLAEAQESGTKVVFITEWHMDALAFMQKEVEQK